MNDWTEDDKLSLATIDALRGAEDVRKRLLLEMSSGTPSVTDLAYAIKIRIKDDYKIGEKVKRKRIEKKTDQYSVHDLRDIVGLRVVTLYRLDAINVIPLLLDRIFDNSGNDEANLFLVNPIEEVKIYSLNPLGDAQNLVGRLRPIFDAKGLSDKLTVEGTSSNYTSIHLVAWCRGKYRSKYRNIPVEIQVRTAFEDVWGEIDHSLKYKPNDDEGTLEEEAQRANILAHLNVMKAMIDGLAQYADQIKIQIDEPRENWVRSVSSRLAEGPLERINELHDVPQGIMETVRHAIGQSRMCFDEVLAGQGLPGPRISSKRRSIDGLAVARSVVRSSDDLDAATKEELLYVLDMERALLLFEYGNGLAGSAGNQALVEASRIYNSVEEKFPERGVVKYRLAKVLDALGDSLAAQRKLEELIKHFEDTDLPQNHWVRAAARRLLGVLYWETARELMTKGVGDSESRAAEARRLLGDAYKVTKPILQMAPEDPPDPGDRPDISEPDKALNNLLYFAVELMSVVEEEKPMPEFEYELGDLRSLLDQAVAEAPKVPEDYRYLNTLRRAYEFTGQGPEASKAAARVVELLAHRGVVDRPGGGRDEEVLREALATIERFPLAEEPEMKPVP